MLDLRQIGFETWIEAVIAGRRPPRTLAPSALAEALERVLTHWRDDAALATSALLTSSLLARTGITQPGPDDLRRLIRRALAEAAEDAGDLERLSYRALEVAYLGRPNSAMRAAHELAVSRATFYRLVKRGLSGLAAHLSAPPPAPHVPPLPQSLSPLPPLPPSPPSPPTPRPPA